MAEAALSRYDLDDRELHLLEMGISDKRRNVFLAVVMWFFLVHFGAHRFYLGKWSTALVLITVEILSLLLLAGSTSGHDSAWGDTLGYVAWFWLVLPLVWAFEGIRLPFLLRRDRQRADAATLQELAAARGSAM